MTALVACSIDPIHAAGPARVIIRYQQPVIADSSELLMRLAAGSQVPVRFAAHIAPDAAAYYLDCPEHDRDCQEAIRHLRSMDGILSIQIDARKK